MMRAADRLVRRLRRDTSGAAAAEMVLVLPLLLMMMFGFVEGARYFEEFHILKNAVRDAARFAARQPMTSMECGAPSADVTDDVYDLIRYMPGTTADRLRNAATLDVGVFVECPGTGSYNNAGLYEELTSGARRVRVTAALDYSPFFFQWGFGAVGRRVVAQEESPVIGI